MKCYIASKPELTGQKLSDTFFAYNRDSTLALLYEDGLLLYVFLLQFFTVDVLFSILWLGNYIKVYLTPVYLTCRYEIIRCYH